MATVILPLSYHCCNNGRQMSALGLVISSMRMRIPRPVDSSMLVACATSHKPTVPEYRRTSAEIHPPANNPRQVVPWQKYVIQSAHCPKNDRRGYQLRQGMRAPFPSTILASVTRRPKTKRARAVLDLCLRSQIHGFNVAWVLNRSI